MSNKAITPKEFYEKMVIINSCPAFGEPDWHDIVFARSEADELMCSVLHKLGYDEGVDYYKRNLKGVPNAT